MKKNFFNKTLTALSKQFCSVIAKNNKLKNKLIMKLLNFKDTNKIFHYISYGFIFLLSFISCIIWIINGIEELIIKKQPYSYQVYEEMNKLKYQSTKFELVNSIDLYIKSVSTQSCLNGIALLDKCIEYDMDICFVLAQGQIESEFGTTGLARKTNSVWNVYAFDGLNYKEICDKGKYKYPDESIEPYLKLLKDDYLVNGKTEYDMMHKYVNKNGKRYASANDYENKIVNTYSKIKKETKIDSLSQELKKYRLILGMY